MSIYTSFSINSMLETIKKNAKHVQLTKENNDNWRLYVLDEKLGEFELTGTLFVVVSSGFKPYIEQAKQALELHSNNHYHKHQSYMPFFNYIEFNDEIKFIFGRSASWCSNVASNLRKLGYNIDRKSEDEQSAVIHFLLTQYLVHGKEWRDKSADIL